ncbi:MAG: single-stranded-DNA-specific exonuclease RecJ [Betaproteobacteria bacterium HGW-Betaproteobacteria-8]|nr:MAG: single-stranded-DNA-specific exonuclease RecJ [Betaproteobacteria bacterium HGW-Betaproteobacteria-8]
MTTIVEREIDHEAMSRLLDAGLPGALAKILAARGIQSPTQLDVSLAGLIPPERLTHNQEMARLLADAIAQQKRLLVVGDYDADGATATTVAVRGLRSMGAEVDFLVPNRFEYGYGLTPEIVALAAKRKPDMIITVDNGIASVDGVDAANALGVTVLITDHHLPGEQTPKAACMINPNQHGCDFPSKHLAGVGVIFYAMLALRAELRKRGAFGDCPEPNLTELLDIVALGTVADLVRLDENNRILVEQGLRRIRAGKACPGINALLKIAGRQQEKVNAQDLGFSVGPRLNAAGRLDDMSLGIACLLTDDEAEAQHMAQQLHELNQARRSIEAGMQELAGIALDKIEPADRYTLSLFHPDWHQGVIGILASRIKERHHRPVIAFAQAGDGLLKGSGRSIKSLHMRDALDLVAKREPDLIMKFGGHAMAAGLTIRENDFERFNQAFEQVAAASLSPADLDAVIEVDGALGGEDMHLRTAALLQKQVWGQGFPAPVFLDVFEILGQRIVGERHLKLSLVKAGRQYDAIFFQQQDLLPSPVALVYELQSNLYNGNESLQLNIKHWQLPN